MPRKHWGLISSSTTDNERQAYSKYSKVSCQSCANKDLLGLFNLSLGDGCAFIEGEL